MREGHFRHFPYPDPHVRALKWPKPNRLGTEWHRGQNQVRLGHTGMFELFSGVEVRPNFHNGTQVKDSRFDSKVHYLYPYEVPASLTLCQDG